MNQIEQRKKADLGLFLSKNSEAEEMEFQGSLNFKVEAYLPFIDSLTSSLEKRSTAYEKVNDNFGFLTNIQTMTNLEIKACCSNLAKVYKKG